MDFKIFLFSFVWSKNTANNYGRKSEINEMKFNLIFFPTENGKNLFINISRKYLYLSLYIYLHALTWTISYPFLTCWHYEKERDKMSHKQDKSDCSRHEYRAWKITLCYV